MLRNGTWIALTLLVAEGLTADPLDQAIRTETQTLQQAAQSQKRIDRLDDATRRMLDEYRRTLREAETLKTYVAHLQKLVESQRREKAELARQLEEIARAEREIVPLMLEMVNTLDRFVALDTPFLPEERRQRIDQLKAMLDSAEVSTAEKFRRILEAYQIENDYAKTIEAYRDELALEGEKRPVDFLRIGRVALFYQTLDGETSGFWNPRQKRWETLPDDYRRTIREGLRIARKEAAPDLLTLPLPTAEEAK
ncbi:hypothetical protein MIT9_P2106 [Methylomarinovum caldicuralii]|uniref:DUF3450 domain-containing protein n=1 Tax=Methylomarinovum caldicuralii TaxID=438856 RepID=A0AAU9CHP8_9GAMM|nr:DUF3450 domain-containing protein [Methylomarinovum caldicuralii]BCX82520.1 hypothetical protein MIT9_P2106 [Methylomarinovum caldicuralii]